MMNSANDVVLGKHLEQLSLAMKRLLYAELWNLSNALREELTELVRQNPTQDDDDNAFTAEELEDIFTNNDPAEAFSQDEVDYIFADGESSGDAISSDDLDYIFG